MVCRYLADLQAILVETKGHTRPARLLSARFGKPAWGKCFYGEKSQLLNRRAGGRDSSRQPFVRVLYGILLHVLLHILQPFVRVRAFYCTALYVFLHFWDLGSDTRGLITTHLT